MPEKKSAKVLLFFSGGRKSKLQEDLLVLFCSLLLLVLEFGFLCCGVLLLVSVSDVRFGAEDTEFLVAAMLWRLGHVEPEFCDDGGSFFPFF